MVTGIPAAQRTQEVELSLQLKWIQIQFIRKIFSSWRLNSLGPLCHFTFSRVGVGGSKRSRPIFLLHYLRRPWRICSGCGRRTRWGRRSTEVDPGRLTSSKAQRLLWTSLRAPGFRIYFFSCQEKYSYFFLPGEMPQFFLLRRILLKYCSSGECERWAASEHIQPFLGARRQNQPTKCIQQVQTSLPVCGTNKWNNVT